MSELDWVHELDTLTIGNTLLLGLDVNSLADDLLAFLLGSYLLGVILLDSALEGLSALTLSHVLHSDVDSLGHDPVSYHFVHDHS